MLSPNILRNISFLVIPDEVIFSPSSTLDKPVTKNTIVGWSQSFGWLPPPIQPHTAWLEDYTPLSLCSSIHNFLAKLVALGTETIFFSLFFWNANTEFPLSETLEIVLLVEDYHWLNHLTCCKTAVIRFFSDFVEQTFTNFHPEGTMSK